MAQKITFSERIKNFELLCKEFSTKEIAKALNRHISSIYREIKRISGPYSPDKAHNNALLKSKNSKKREIFQNKELKFYVLEKLNLFWSPEQISKRLKIDFANNSKMRVSTETIYKFIYNIKDIYEIKN